MAEAPLRQQLPRVPDGRGGRSAPPCLFAGYAECVADGCERGLRPCPSPSGYAERCAARRPAINRAALVRHIEWKNETRNLFQLLLAKGSITVAHRHKPSIWRRIWLAL